LHLPNISLIYISTQTLKTAWMLAGRSEPPFLSRPMSDRWVDCAPRQKDIPTRHLGLTNLIPTTRCPSRHLLPQRQHAAHPRRPSQQPAPPVPLTNLLLLPHPRDLPAQAQPLPTTPRGTPAPALPAHRRRSAEPPPGAPHLQLAPPGAPTSTSCRRVPPHPQGAARLPDLHGSTLRPAAPGRTARPTPSNSITCSPTQLLGLQPSGSG
jgi:hypothetical protein